MRIATLPLARPTFDVAYAEAATSEMLAALDAWAQAGGHTVAGPRHLLMEADDDALAQADGADVLLILQATFTDAAFAAQVVAAFPGRVAVWAAREPRAGGRLRLNAFCGLNLLSHALGLADRPFTWAYGEADLDALLTGEADAPRVGTVAGAEPIATRPLRIGRIGRHPDGFHTCAYDPEILFGLTGSEVHVMDLSDLFDRARAMEPAAVEPFARKAAALAGVDALDAEEVERSTRLAGALEALREERHLDAVAIRCWPECFTEYGGAACGGVAMHGERRFPCACEADVYGAVTQSILQDVADAPVFLADLVDMDDQTGVVWHCGQAPASMAAGTPAATVHTNRRQALLQEFALRPGRVTLFRLSQARGHHQAIFATGEVVDAPMAFTGTSGTVRFDRPAARVAADVMASGLEHHMALAYGDHAETLRGVAAHLDIPVLELGA